ncbi:unnamed protein product [Orchesella dallaii]|uniref:Uncharacterized protein n=1 Tax=Orchesella dallaii TaxID=48710 RepID=A0ABP1RAY4_9HEXA
MFPSQLGLSITFFLLSISPRPILSSFETFLSYSVSPIRELASNNLTLQQYFRMLDIFDTNYKQQIPYIESEFPGISNLNQQLTPFTTANCLISLHNFRYIDIFAKTPLEYPILLWTPELGEVAKWSSWMPKDFTKKTSVTLVNDTLSCDTSNLLRKVGYSIYDPGICLDLDLFTFSSLSKPWNCQVDIYLYQPDRKRKERYPNIFRRIPKDIEEKDFSRALIYYRVPSVKILVSHNTLQYVDRNILKLWVTNIITDSRKRSVNFAYLFASVQSNSESSGIINSVKIVRECQNCLKIPENKKEMARTLDVILEEINLNFNSLERLDKLSHFNPSESIHWAIQSDFLEYKLAESAIFHLAVCDKRLITAQYLLHSHLDISPMEKLAKAYAHIWLSIMKNSTFKRDIGGGLLTVCYPSRGEIMVEHSFDSIMTLREEMFLNSGSRGRAMEVQLDLSALKFVSCGRRTLQSMAFRELIDVYDPAVWVFVGLSMMILMIALEQLSRSTGWMSLFNIWKHWLPIFKSIIEQGDPFPNRYLKTSPIRLVVSLFMLAMIVLTNAYKNNNVYNMIAPRNAVPYKYLHELVQDNFTIYGRSSVVRFHWHNSKKPNWSIVNISQHYICVGRYNSEVHSEVSISLQNLLRKEKALSTKTYNDSILLMKLVKNSTDLHPSLFSVLKPRFAEIDAINPFPFWSSDEIIGPFIERFSKEEDVILTQFIEECDRTALVLPQHLCMKHAHRLQRLGKEDVFIGEETYVNQLYTYALIYRIPSFIVKRLSGTKEAGIWEWWMKLLKGSDAVRQYPKAPTKPNLDGNVLVIFSLLCIGLCVASTCFLLETWKYFGFMGIKVWSTFAKCRVGLRRNSRITPDSNRHRHDQKKLLEIVKVNRITVIPSNK